MRNDLRPDSNIALKWVLSEADSDKEIRLRAAFQNQVHDLHAPDVFPVEIAHALTRAERRGVIPQGEAERPLADILSSPPRLHPYLPLLTRAIRISSQHHVGVYDCLYLALAEREHCEFLTTDDRLLRTLKPTFPFITPLASLP